MEFSGNLLRGTTGKECLLPDTTEAGASLFELALAMRGIPGLVLPTEVGLSGNFVLRFGGVS